MERLCQCAEEASLNAWPALKEIFYDGWLIRLAGGESRRTNSVSVLGPGAEPLARKLARCADVYGAHRQPVIVRTRSLDEPALDRFLAAEGFALRDHTRTLFLDLSVRWLREPGPDVEITPWPSRNWLVAHQRFTGRSSSQTRMRARQLALIALPCGFASLRHEGAILAVAYGAVDDRMMSVQWVATDPAHRQRGLARATLSALFAWGRQAGAQGACLQVLADNEPAIALYRRLGFARELYCYHYRQR